MNQFTERRKRPSLPGTSRLQWGRRDQKYWRVMMMKNPKTRAKRSKLYSYIFYQINLVLTVKFPGLRTQDGELY